MNSLTKRGLLLAKIVRKVSRPLALAAVLVSFSACGGARPLPGPSETENSNYSISASSSRSSSLSLPPSSATQSNEVSDNVSAEKGKGGNGTTNGGTLRAAVREPAGTFQGPGVRSEVHDRRGLRAVQSIYMAPILIEERARAALPNQAAMTEELRERLTAELDIELLDSSSVLAESGQRRRENSSLTAAQASAESLGIGPTSARASESDLYVHARASGAESLLVTSLKEFHPRSGSALGAQEAAAVTLGMQLHALDGTLLWSAGYVFRDQAVSDNLFRLGDRLFQSNEGVPGARALGFKSERELLSAGLRGAARALATDRTALFAAATK